MLGILFIDTVEEAFVGTISKGSSRSFALFARQNVLSMDNPNSGYPYHPKGCTLIYFEIKMNLKMGLHIHSELYHYKLTT